MATSYPARSVKDTAMSTDSARHATMTASSGGFLARLGVQVRQTLCGLHGHDELLHFERGRISLECASCGYQSPGWEVKGTTAQPGDAAGRQAPRARVLRLPLDNHRRVA